MKVTKRILAFFLAVIMIASFLPPVTSANVFLSSSGTLEQGSIPISNAFQLAEIQPGNKYHLVNDIDLGKYNNGIWIPISYGDSISSIYLDGRGYKVYNLNIPDSSNTQFAGLFGRIFSQGDITIKNLGIEIQTCIANSNNAVNTVANGHNTNSSSYAGGIIASSYGNLIIDNCWVTGEIYSSAKSFSWSGGLVGYSNKPVSISNSYSMGSVDTITNSDGSAVAAGIVGFGSNIITIEKSYSSMNISAINKANKKYSSMAGGLIGYNDSESYITNCYSMGDILASSSHTSHVGNIAGFPYRKTIIENCYGTGKITGSNAAGGIIGYNYNGNVQIINSFFNKDTTNQKNGIGNISSSTNYGKTTDEMKLLSTYTNWDFDMVWKIDPNVNNGFPHLNGMVDKQSDFGTETSESSRTDDNYLPATIQIFNGHTYAVYDISMTWHQAKKYCEDLDGHLVTITSQEEQDFVQNLIKDRTKNQYWIGATDEEKSRDWKWVTGEPWSYTNWGIGEPNNYRSIEHYVQMYRIPNPVVYQTNALGKWNDISVDNFIKGEEKFFSLEFIGFICEWDYVRSNGGGASPWAEDAINRAKSKELNLLPPSLDNNYQQNITREEFCDLAVPLYEKIEGKFRLSSLAFDDATNPNVMHMASIGVVNGYPNSNGTTSFKPKNEIIRQEAAAILCRLTEALGHELVQLDPTFTDVKYDEQHKWAYYYIGKIQASGIMGGVGNNQFDPFGKYTREQAIVTMMRVWDLVEYLCPAPIAWDKPVASFLYDEVPEREKHFLSGRGIEFWKFQSYNIEHSGMIAEKWEYIKYSNGTLNVKFTIHNNNATAGEVLIFDKDNTLVGRRIISAYVQNPTDLKSYFSGLLDLIMDTVHFDWIFNQQRINSKSTDININIPKGGYMVIHNDTNSSDSLQLLYSMAQIGTVVNFISNGTNILNLDNLNNTLNNTDSKNKKKLKDILDELDSIGILPYLLSLATGDVDVKEIAITWSNFSKIVKELMTNNNIYSLLDKLSPDMSTGDTYVSLLFGAGEKAITNLFKGTPASPPINGMFMVLGGANFINAVRDYNRTLSSGYVRIDNR